MIERKPLPNDNRRADFRSAVMSAPRSRGGGAADDKSKPSGRFQNEIRTSMPTLVDTFEGHGWPFSTWKRAANPGLLFARCAAAAMGRVWVGRIPRAAWVRPVLCHSTVRGRKKKHCLVSQTMPIFLAPGD